MEQQLKKESEDTSEIEVEENINPDLVKLLLTQPELIASNPSILKYGLSGGVINKENLPEMRELSREELIDIGLVEDDVEADNEEEDNEECNEYEEDCANKDLTDNKRVIEIINQEQQFTGNMQNPYLSMNHMNNFNPYINNLMNVNNAPMNVNNPPINVNNVPMNVNNVNNPPMNNLGNMQMNIPMYGEIHNNNLNYSQPQYSYNPYMEEQQVESYIESPIEEMNYIEDIVEGHDGSQQNSEPYMQNFVNQSEYGNYNDVRPQKRELNMRQIKQSNMNRVHRSDLLTALTWNIWFEQRNQKERTLRIIQIIKQLSPDFICLQEVTPLSYNIIKSRLLDYQIFEIFIEEGYSYGTCILCKKETVEVVDPYYYDYTDTQMGRRLVGCEVRLSKHGGKKIHILTTHLESMWENKEVRNLQFDTIKEVIKDINEDIILAGDFNICSVREPIEWNLATTKLVDVWVECGCPSSIKYTYDSKINKNLSGGNMRSRLDRIYYMSNSGMKSQSLKLVGLNSTSPNILEQPSDHFGLMTEFLLK